jgi:putative inorganic carbon (HCO3(-)) transporter
MVAPLAVATAVKGAGLLIAVLAAGGALALRSPRARTAAALLALGLTPVLLLGELWQSPQLVHLRAHGALAAAAVVAGVVLVGGLAALLHRRPWLLPVLAVGALPFRIPLESGGQSANLLLPLYVVVAAGVLALAWERLGPPSRRPGADAAADSAWREREPGWTELALIAVTVLYALQAFYSADFEQALKNVAFFYVPFMLLLKLLSTVRWTPRVFTACFSLAVVLALLFAGIGFAEYATKHLFWNQKVIASNQFESYFRVNSLFFDPNIYGRFLAMVMIGLAAILLWGRRGRDVAIAAAVLVVLWAALVVTFSQSSFAALLTGLAVLAALRFGWRPVVAAAGAVAVAGVVLALAAPNALHLNLRSGASVNRASAGRLDLMRGGLRMFTDRPLFGFGSGAFAKKFRERERSGSRAAASASHTIPITVAAEEGVPGLGAYAAVLIASFGLLFAGLGPLRGRAPPPRLVTRAYLAAAFAGLIVHTLLYAAFLEDPITWTLLAAGIVLGRAEPLARTAASGASAASAASASASAST